MADLVGGQAIFEGVMIRKGTRWVAAARREDDSIALTEGAIPPRDRWWWKVPVLRGALATLESVRVGLAATRWSQSLARDHADPPVRERVLAIGVAIAVLVVFLLVPTSLAHALVGHGWAGSLLEGLFSLALFVSYLWGIGRLPAIRRTFGFHGAEHMVVSAWEHTGEISPEAARRESVRHPRCGTDLLLMVMLVAVVVFRFLPAGFSLEAIVARVVAVPIVAGIAYELLRLGGTTDLPWLHRILAGPGLAAQRLTTAPPDDGQVEVAVAAMRELASETGAGRFPEPAHVGAGIVDDPAVGVEHHHGSSTITE